MHAFVLGTALLLAPFFLASHGVSHVVVSSAEVTSEQGPHLDPDGLHMEGDSEQGAHLDPDG